LSKEGSNDDVDGAVTVNSALEEVDRDTKLQFEQCALECIGKCWPPTTADTQGINSACC